MLDFHPLKKCELPGPLKAGCMDGLGKEESWHYGKRKMDPKKQKKIKRFH